MSELKMMTHIGSHENIVNLLGACTTSGKEECLAEIRQMASDNKVSFTCCQFCTLFLRCVVSSGNFALCLLLRSGTITLEWPDQSGDSVPVALKTLCRNNFSRCGLLRRAKKSYILGNSFIRTAIKFAGALFPFGHLCQHQQFLLVVFVKRAIRNNSQ